MLRLRLFIEFNFNQKIQEMCCRNFLFLNKSYSPQTSIKKICQYDIVLSLIMQILTIFDILQTQIDYYYYQCSIIMGFNIYITVFSYLLIQQIIDKNGRVNSIKGQKWFPIIFYCWCFGRFFYYHIEVIFKFLWVLTLPGFMIQNAQSSGPGNIGLGLIFILYRVLMTCAYCLAVNLSYRSYILYKQLLYKEKLKDFTVIKTSETEMKISQG